MKENTLVLIMFSSPQTNKILQTMWHDHGGEDEVREAEADRLTDHHRVNGAAEGPWKRDRDPALYSR